MDFEKEKDDFPWRKEEAGEKKQFDFDEFLGAEDESLDDRVTDVMDGRDLLDPDAFGEFSPDYIPRRRAGDGTHGRHEAPEQEDFVPEPPEESPDLTDPRYAAPERPRVVARPTVYVTPESAEQFDVPTRTGTGSGRRGTLKAAVVALAVIAVILGVVIALVSGGDSGNREQGDISAQVTATPPTIETPAPTDEQKPEETPEPTAPPKKSYSITVTAGTGGSITPSGVVTVEEGGGVSFSIIPDAGHSLSQLLVDGSAVSTTESYTFSNVTDNHTIYAVFQTVSTATPAPTATTAPTPEPTAEPTPEPTPEPTAPPATEPPVYDTPNPEVNEGL